MLQRKEKTNASEEVLLVRVWIRQYVTYSLLNLSNAWKVSGEKSVILLLSKYLNVMVIEILLNLCYYQARCYILCTVYKILVESRCGLFDWQYHRYRF